MHKYIFFFKNVIKNFLKKQARNGQLKQFTQNN